jgi:tetrahydromethanopterin S-methyltransferase subunit G
MDDKDLEKIENLMNRAVHRFKGEIIQAFDQRIGILEENLQHKLELLAEGHRMLFEKVESAHHESGSRLKNIEQRIDVMVGNLADHRQDTEAHKGYKVCEP